MKLPHTLLFLGFLALTGCESVSGIDRSAQIHDLPDLVKIKARIESYPEVKRVTFSHTAGWRPIGENRKADTEEFSFYYTDGKDVRGELHFVRNNRGEIFCSNSVTWIAPSPIPQSCVDATWPVMKRIEQDLIESFNLPEIRQNVKIQIWQVEDPERKRPNQSVQPTPGSVTPRAIE